MDKFEIRSEKYRSLLELTLPSLNLHFTAIHLWTELNGLSSKRV